MKIIIGTPSYDGKVDVRYTNALINTIRMAPSDMQIFPVFMPGDALIQRARNELIKIAMDAQADFLVFIDADIVWNPEDFFRLLSTGKDFIGGVYRQKKDEKTLVFKEKGGEQVEADGTLEVLGVGTGFLALSKYCLDILCNNSGGYLVNGVETKNIFEVLVEDNDLISEDIVLCRKWMKLGGKCFVHFDIFCDHIGQKIYEVTK